MLILKRGESGGEHSSLCGAWGRKELIALEEQEVPSSWTSEWQAVLGGTEMDRGLFLKGPGGHDSEFAFYVYK